MKTIDNQIKFRFELNDKLNRFGLAEVYLIITDSGRKQKIKTEVQVKAEHFGIVKDVIGINGKVIKNKRVLTIEKWITNKDSEAAYKNDKLKKKLDEYKKAYDMKKDEDSYVNKEAVINAVNNKYVLKDVITVIERYIKELKDADDYPNTKGYLTTKSHLITFLAENKLSKIDFRHINKVFLVKFEKYLFKTINRGNGSDSSVHTIMKRLRRIFNYAIGEEIITPDIYPFGNIYQLPKVKPKFKERLTGEELTQFASVKYEPGSLIFNSQQCFMLAVRMAGTRIEDMLNLRVKNIYDGRITFNMRKGITNSKLKSIKIDSKIQEILNYYITKNSTSRDLIFPFLPPSIETWSNTQYKKEVGRKTALVNKYLKIIAVDACIGKKVTTHISRHSFATAALKVTKDIKSLQEAFGHSDPKITAGYLSELNVENLDEMMASIEI